MNLKEFDLDFPYIESEEIIQTIINEKNCSRNEAIRIDYNTNWKNKRRQFSLETRCISSMFSRLFGKMKTEACRKILIECVQIIHYERILNFSGVYTVQVQFDNNKFNSSEDFQKKQQTLELLMKGIKKVVLAKGWSIEPFESVIKRIVESNYCNEWVWRKPVRNPDKKLSAEVFCQHEVKNIDISIMLRDKKGIEISKAKIITELPDEYAYAKHLGELKWLSNDQVALINKKGDRTWNVNVRR